MTEAVIVSGGNIQKDFALDFLRKNKNKDYYMIAADRGLEFFMETGLVPDAAVGDFDSLSPEGLAYLESLENTGFPDFICGWGSTAVVVNGEKI